MSLLFSNPQTIDYVRHWVRASSTGQAVWFSLLMRYFPSPRFVVGVTSSPGNVRRNDLTMVMIEENVVIVLDASVSACRSSRTRKRAVKSARVKKEVGGRRSRKEVTEGDEMWEFDVRRSGAFQYMRRLESPTIGIIGRGSRFVAFEGYRVEGVSGEWGFRYIEVEPRDESWAEDVEPGSRPSCIVDQAEGLDGLLKAIKEKALSCGVLET